MSPQIVAILKKLEGFRSKPYFDVKGYSVGYGHFIGNNTAAYAAGITEAQATQILLDDISKIESAVQKYFTKPLTGYQLDAITLWGFNFGPDRLKEATFKKLINEGGAQSEIEKWWTAWNKVNGKTSTNHLQRRIMETDIYYERIVRLPDYIGGGTMKLQGANTSAIAETEDLPPLVVKKKFPIIPIIIGSSLVGAYLVFIRRRKPINGIIDKVNNIPFWAKISIAGGLLLTATTAVVYANTATKQPYFPTIDMTNASLTNNNKTLTSEGLTINNIVADLPKHATKKYLNRDIALLTHIVVHHTAGSSTETPESIANYHVKKNGYPGIGYHFVIAQDGTIYQTNHITTKSYHVAEFNTGVVGVNFVGNFDIKNQVPAAQIESGTKLIVALRAAIEKATGKKLPIRGHKEVARKGHATACPGRFFPLDTFKNL